MNLGIFTGNLGRDAKVNQTNTGMSVMNFALAVKTGFGERESTMWVSCTLWGKRAEGGVVQYMTKGQQVAVSGELSMEEYQAKDGTTKTTLKLNVRDLDLIGGKSQQQPQQQPAQQQPSQQQPNDVEFDSDIPF